MSLLLLLSLLLYATHHSVVVLASAQTISTSSTTEDFGIDLYALSDMELEEICTIRGFELVQEVDDATGEQYVFTHEDYVEAAKQCLAIERDMEEIIAEHPEILSELEAERDRMMDEKEKLEKQLQEAKQKDEQKSLLEEEDEEVHAAFVTKPKTTTSSSEASAPVKEPKQKTTTAETMNTEEPQSSTQLEQQQQQPSSPLSLPELVKSTMLEFRERVQRDVQKLYDMALPASIREPLAQTLRPLWTIAKQLTKDVTKFLIRHVRALVKQTTEQLKERKERRRQAAATSEDK